MTEATAVPAAPASAAPPAAPAPAAPTATAPATNGAPPAAAWTVATPATETKTSTPPVEAAKVEAKPDKKEEAKYALKVPAGSDLDTAALERYVDFAKSHGLTEQAAQALVDRDHEAQKAQVEALKQQDAQWLGELEKDAEFGHQKFAENAEHAKRFFDWVDPDGSLREDLKTAGLAHWPKLVKLAAARGRMMAEDRLHAGADGVAKAPKSPEQRLKESYQK